SSGATPVALEYWPRPWIGPLLWTGSMSGLGNIGCRATPVGLPGTGGLATGPAGNGESIGCPGGYIMGGYIMLWGGMGTAIGGCVSTVPETMSKALPLL